MSRRLRASSILASVLLPLLLAGCSGDDAPTDDAATPREVVDAARQTLDDSSGLSITLSTEDLPRGVTGITSAEGQVAHPPAFDGTFDLSVKGFPATAEVITVDGITYAKNALLLPDWTEIDPSDYGAPDPVVLMTPGEGLSALVGAITDLEEGDRARGGADNTEILTTYTGSVPAEAVAGVIPTASGDFDVTVLITDDGELRQILATGEFYADADPLTYTIGFDDYGAEPDITAP